MLRWLTLVVAMGLAVPALAAESAPDDSLERSVQELRDSIGRWNVVTEFLQPDGSVAQTVEGIYTFEWVTKDRVVQGRSELPSLGRSAGILFYVNEAARTIEMVSVGADGKLWVMTGAVGGDTRYTQPFKATDGTESRLRFTRYNVESDRFESRMEHTSDGGRTWIRANHQVFERAE